MKINRTKNEFIKTIINLKNEKISERLKRPLIKRDMYTESGEPFGNLFNIISECPKLTGYTDYSFNDFLVKPIINRNKYTDENSFSNIFDAEKRYRELFRECLTSDEYKFLKSESDNALSYICDSIFPMDDSEKKLYIIPLMESEYSLNSFDMDTNIILTSILNGTFPKSTDSYSTISVLLNNNTMADMVDDIREILVDHITSEIEKYEKNIINLESTLSLESSNDSTIADIHKLEEVLKRYKDSLENLDSVIVPISVIDTYSRYLVSNLTSLENINKAAIMFHIIKHYNNDGLNSLKNEIGTNIASLELSASAIVSNYNKLIEKLLEEDKRFIVKIK